MKKENLRKEKGITLIALVITIIVMLILVGVTITIAVNGGLFDYAKYAAEETNKAKEYELGLATTPENLDLNDYDGLINYYTQNGTQSADPAITATATGSTVTITKVSENQIDDLRSKLEAKLQRGSYRTYSIRNVSATNSVTEMTFDLTNLARVGENVFVYLYENNDWDQVNNTAIQVANDKTITIDLETSEGTVAIVVMNPPVVIDDPGYNPETH